jgi:hypothetical protein
MAVDVRYQGCWAFGDYREGDNDRDHTHVNREIFYDGRYQTSRLTLFCFLSGSHPVKP